MNTTHEPSRALLASRICLLLAAGAALYQSAVSMGSTPPPGCGLGSHCHEVLTSRWSRSWGIPVSFPGLAAYVTAVICSGAVARREGSFKALAGVACVTGIIAAALLFTAFQVEMRAFCILCLATHAAALTGAVLLIKASRSTGATPALSPHNVVLKSPGLFRGAGCGAGLLGVAMLALGSLDKAAQHATDQSVAAATAPAGSSIALFGGKITIDPAAYPSIGAAGPDSAVLLSDYTCKFCREYQSVLSIAAASSGRSIVILPVARSEKATAIQRTMLTLFHADRQIWHTLSTQIYNGQLNPEPDTVIRAAMKAMGDAKWNTALGAHRVTVEKQLETAATAYEATFTQNSGRLLPLLLRGDRMLTGAETDTAAVEAFLKHGVLPPGSEPAAGFAGDGTPPVLSPDTGRIQLPEAKPGDTIAALIPFMNKGGKPLNVQWLEMDEGCLVTEKPTAAILPGAKGKLTLSVKTPPAAGEFTRTVRIHTNNQDPVTVTIQGRVAASPATAPAK
jgi:uncharacterized membrane protein